MFKIPYGISDYKTLKEENYYYVDKTMYLEKIEDIQDNNLQSFINENYKNPYYKCD